MSSNSPVLLVSLGTSPAIVPEAFLLPGADFRAVHVLTTAKPPVSLVQEFFAAQAPGVALQITRVDGFDDFRTETDHFHFEEVLYRWVLETKTQPSERCFCVAGGFKTMSAAMQKAAALLGAGEVFHVRAEEPLPKALHEIVLARKSGHLHFIRLGPEAGWPQLRAASSSEYPLEVVRSEGGVRWVRASNDAFRIRVHDLVERSQRIAGAWESLADLPFPDLATWSEPDLAWLAQPLAPDSPADCDWVARLPKVELHCHLGGFATSGKLLETVRSAAVDPGSLPALRDLATLPGWPLPTEPVRLETYRHLGDNNGSAILRDPGCLQRQCELLYDHLLEQGVLYAEIRCSPANYADSTQGQSPWQVLEDIRTNFQRCMEAAASNHAARPAAPLRCHVHLIVIGTREERGDYRAHIARHLALAVTAAEHWRDEAGCRVVGVDLAGYEDVETRAHYFRDEFIGVHRCGLALTVHAGENDDAEGIWRAVFDLNARRLGHALSLAQSPELLRSVIDRGVGIEMCPYANLQIRGFPLDAAALSAPAGQCYPLRDYLAAGARVTVNTDNVGISSASLADNLLLAARLCPGLTRLDILRLERHALDTAFVSAGQRLELIRRFASAIPRP